MRSWLGNLLRELFGDSIARVLGGAGLSLTTAAVLIPLVTTALNQAADALAGVGGEILQLALLFGIGEAMSIVGSAVLTRMAMTAGSIGIRKAGRG
jgi:Protein of unknown function (DUF2523).